MNRRFTDAEVASPYAVGSQILVDGQWWTVEKSEFWTYPPALQSHRPNSARDGWFLQIKGHGILRTAWHWQVSDAKAGGT